MYTFVVVVVTIMRGLSVSKKKKKIVIRDTHTYSRQLVVCSYMLMIIWAQVHAGRCIGSFFHFILCFFFFFLLRTFSLRFSDVVRLTQFCFSSFLAFLNYYVSCNLYYYLRAIVFPTTFLSATIFPFSSYFCVRILSRTI